jgi:tol-pal system protein YbgF
MKSRILIAAVSLSALAACFVPQSKIAQTDKDITTLRADVKAMKDQLAELRKRIDRVEPDVTGATDLQKSLADYGVRIDQFATDLQILQGKLEENNFRLSEIGQKLDDRGFKVDELGQRVEELDKKVKALAEGGAAAAQGEQDKKKAPAKAPEPSEVYRQAKNDYDAGNFDLSIAGFENYLKQFPSASQADNAHYWIGESYYSKKDYPKAIEAFSKLLKSHPKSAKAPAARLKIGYSYQNEKNVAKAKEHLQKVIKDYPSSKEAVLARERLKKIEKTEKP